MNLDSNEPEIFDFEEKTKEKRYHKNIMEIYIQVVNLFCELSDQIIQFLPTPCGSFSTVIPIHLRLFILKMKKISIQISISGVNPIERIYLPTE